MRTPLLLTPLLALVASAAAEVAISRDDAAKTVAVTIDGKPFTALVWNTYPKPVLYPIHGPGGVPITRNWPMKDDVAGEDKDHPHHKSLWFGHGAMNGVDFWAEKEGFGRVTTDSVTKAAVEDGVAVIGTANKWLAPDGKVVCTDTTEIRAGEDGGNRWIDYAITFHASEGDVTFGDTKEGTMAIRTRPELNLDAKKNKLAAGQCTNSEGQTGQAIWGKKARWVDYWAPVEGKTLGVAIFDAPGNLRHPTTWHAREYGLIAANPFGLHDFTKGTPKGAGDFILKKGESRTWRYRFLFHTGDAKTADIDAAWQKWAAAAK